MSNLVSTLIKEYQRRLVLRQGLRRARGKTEPMIAAPKRKPEPPRPPETKPYRPASNHHLRAFQF
jgi:hypothetical protein